MSGVEVGSITQGRDLGLHVTVLYRENENWRTCRRGVSSIERPEKRVYTFWRTGRGESSIERLDERVDTSS